MITGDITGRNDDEHNCGINSSGNDSMTDNELRQVEARLMDR